MVSLQLHCSLIGEVKQLNFKVHKLPLWMISCRAKQRPLRSPYTGRSVKTLSRSGRGRGEENWKTY